MVLYKSFVHQYVQHYVNYYTIKGILEFVVDIEVYNKKDAPYLYFVFSELNEEDLPMIKAMC